MTDLKREIKILKNLKDGPNIVKIKEVVIDLGTKCPTIVFEYMPFIDCRESNDKIKLEDIQMYHYQLLNVKLYLFIGFKIFSFNGNNS